MGFCAWRGGRDEVELLALNDGSDCNICYCPEDRQIFDRVQLTHVSARII